GPEAREPGAEEVAAANKAAEQLGANKTISTVLGEIVWLMTQSKEHRALPIAALDTLVMPAILMRRFRLFYQGEAPAAAVIYATLSADAAA
ncbi:toxin-activating lysine-acyltransferase, partial [Acinetobacter baumannii]